MRPILDDSDALQRDVDAENSERGAIDASTIATSIGPKALHRLSRGSFTEKNDSQVSTS